MKWFKHLSGSLNNSIIFEAIEKYGSDAYLVFFGTLEMMADEFDINNPGVSRISAKKMTKNLQLSRQKVARILAFFDKKANEKPTENKSFFVLDEKTHFLVTCPKLKELCDEWTQKQLKKVGSESGEDRDKLPPKEEEEEEEVKDSSSEKKTSDTKKLKFTEEDMSLSKKIFSAVKIINPTAKEPNWNAWANSIRLMREADKRKTEDIWRVFEWANKDSFWSANILCPAKLREKFDTISAKMNCKKPVNIPPTVIVGASGKQYEF